MLPNVDNVIRKRSQAISSALKEAQGYAITKERVL